jgi:hypothetical protein
VLGDQRFNQKKRIERMAEVISFKNRGADDFKGSIACTAKARVTGTNTELHRILLFDRSAFPFPRLILFLFLMPIHQVLVHLNLHFHLRTKTDHGVQFLVLHSTTVPPVRRE